MQLLTLAIDTSCDETSVAVTCGLEVWSNVIASQVELHRPYGGVFPTVAKQAHKENIEGTVKSALQRGRIQLQDIEQIAITIGPGLAPALEVGINYAKTLAEKLQVPLVPVNHLEAHLLSVHALSRPKSAWGSLKQKKTQATKNTQNYLKKLNFPNLGLIVSGGHTLFVLVEKPQPTPSSSKPTQTNNLNPMSQSDRQPNLKLTKQDDLPYYNSGLLSYTLLGQTIDDAAGEALDKIGRMINLGYPAGPVIEQFAKLGNKQKYPFPLPMTQSKNYDLSFSGLKTYARNFCENKWQNNPGKQEIYDFSASIQYAIFRHICYKLSKILNNYPEIKNIWLGGGVAANLELRKVLRDILKPTKLNKTQTKKLLTPYSKKLCGDNAAMIGLATSV